jgi:hypothetical protein
VFTTAVRFSSLEPCGLVLLWEDFELDLCLACEVATLWHEVWATREGHVYENLYPQYRSWGHGWRLAVLKEGEVQ